MRLIKFDLPVDGVKVKSIDELREHFTAEILMHYRSGLLLKWLRSRGLVIQAEAVQALTESDDFGLLAALCRVFDVTVDDDILHVLIDEATPVPDKNISALVQRHDALAAEIDVSIYVAVCRVPVNSPGHGKLGWSEPGKYRAGQLIAWTSGPKAYAPGVGRLRCKTSYNANAEFNKGDIAGWFGISVYANDHAQDLFGYRSLLLERAKILGNLAAAVNFPLLQAALERRTVLLKEVAAAVLEACKKPSDQGLEMLKALPKEQQQLLFLDMKPADDESTHGTAFGAAVATAVGASLFALSSVLEGLGTTKWVK